MSLILKHKIYNDSSVEYIKKNALPYILHYHTFSTIMFLIVSILLYFKIIRKGHSIYSIIISFLTGIIYPNTLLGIFGVFVKDIFGYSCDILDISLDLRILTLFINFSIMFFLYLHLELIDNMHKNDKIYYYNKYSMIAKSVTCYMVFYLFISLISLHFIGVDIYFFSNFEFSTQFIIGINYIILVLLFNILLYVYEILSNKNKYNKEVDVITKFEEIIYLNHRNVCLIRGTDRRYRQELCDGYDEYHS